MRFFIAFEVPDQNKQQIKQIQDELSQIIPGLRLTDSNKLHLTLAFLAEQPDELKDQLIQIIQQATQGVPPFSVTPSYIDGFPNLHHAHTLWIGVKGDVDKLFLIRERLKDGLKHINITIDERRYTPHIAIAKAAYLQLSIDQETAIEHLDSYTLQTIQINSIKLFESIPSEGFHTHNTLAEIRLAE